MRARKTEQGGPGSSGSNNHPGIPSKSSGGAHQGQQNVLQHVRAEQITSEIECERRNQGNMIESECRASNR